MGMTGKLGQRLNGSNHFEHLYVPASRLQKKQLKTIGFCFTGNSIEEVRMEHRGDQKCRCKFEEAILPSGWVKKSKDTEPLGRIVDDRMRTRVLVHDDGLTTPDISCLSRFGITIVDCMQDDTKELLSAAVCYITDAERPVKPVGKTANFWAAREIWSDRPSIGLTIYTRELTMLCHEAERILVQELGRQWWAPTKYWEVTKNIF